MIGSWKTGTGSVKAGQGSVKTAYGVCAPFPGEFLTDGASFKAGGEAVDTAASPPACGTSCTPGTVAFDQTFAPVVAVASSGIAGPTFGVWSQLIGDLPCANYRLEVTADCAWTGLVGPIRNGGALHTYLAPTGSDLATRAFTGTNVLSPQLANIPANETDNAYRTYSFKAYPAGAPASTDFAGPLVNYTLYIWPPVLGPDFIEGFWNVKNVHVVITTL